MATNSNNESFLDAMVGVLKLLKQSEESTEVFKGFVNLSQISKSFKKYLNDEFMVKMSYRYIRGTLTNYQTFFYM